MATADARDGIQPSAKNDEDRATTQRQEMSMRLFTLEIDIVRRKTLTERPR